MSNQAPDLLPCPCCGESGEPRWNKIAFGIEVGQMSSDSHSAVFHLWA
jgi:hypothetical protein